jgi:5-methylcytosine-specific restriction endonuclease McrA
MDAQVLALNSGYMPIDIIPWRQAITDVFSGRAVVEENYEDLFIRTSSMSFPMPSIIRFVTKAFGFFRRGVKFNRKNIWLRDRGVCQYCGHKVPVTNFTFDHVVPRNQGGKSVWENIVVACHPCNQKKKDMTPVQAKMKLLTKPIRPKNLPGLWTPMGWKEEMPKSWKAFLASERYWNDTLDA